MMKSLIFAKTEPVAETEGDSQIIKTPMPNLPKAPVIGMTRKKVSQKSILVQYINYLFELS